MVIASFDCAEDGTGLALMDAAMEDDKTSLRHGFIGGRSSALR
jgi:hypothetical protein